MQWSSEVQLAAVIGAIYLYDCTLLLYSSEAVIERAGSRFRMLSGSPQIQIRGRLVLLLNPLLPHRPSFRASWDAARSHPDARDMDLFATALKKLYPFLTLVWPLILVVVPGALLVLTTPGFLLAVAFTYLAIIALLVRLWFLRKSLHLTNAKFSLLAFECMVCPPCSANLLRKLSLSFAAVPDLITLVTGLLKSEKRDAALKQIVTDIEASLAMEEPGSPRYIRLSTVLERARQLIAAHVPSALSNDELALEKLK
jgi:hypothetical protein